mmetsp:Transcript_105075/g.240737  ORF Transcript_105075/g.240737 Transcript_105075/m.240737 type:complete len:665 (+) Transcript_105075:45-2039(+)
MGFQPPSRTRSGAIWWIRSDVRIADNAAFLGASQHSHVVPTFLWDEVWRPRWSPSGAAAIFLQDALKNLHGDLKRSYSSGVVARRVRDGPPAVKGCGPAQIHAHAERLAQALTTLCFETGSDTVFASKEYHPDEVARDKVVDQALKVCGIKLHLVPGHLLNEPHTIPLYAGGEKSDLYWGTVLPFWRALKNNQHQRPTPRPARAAVRSPPAWPEGEAIGEGRFFLTKTGNSPGPCKCQADPVNCRSHWALPIKESWDASEAAGQRLLDCFAAPGAAMSKYEQQRSRADLPMSTSRLSPYLRFGLVSVRAVHFAIRDADIPHEDKKTMGRRLYWRDLAYFQHYCFPHMSTKCIRVHHDNTEWTEGEEREKWLKAWQRGQTGYPVVDAGMRELEATGWMNQSVRIVAAGFLTEFLNLPWQDGHRWFHDRLIDADAPINAMMWQNGGRSGCDQWNFIVSVDSGSQDPTGEYVAKWVPELAPLRRLGTKQLHKPWTIPLQTLRAHGVELGHTYPHRVIADLEKARERTVECVHNMLLAHPQQRNKDGIDLITLPDGQRVKVYTRFEYRVRENKPKPRIKELQRPAKGKGKGKGNGGETSGSSQARSRPPGPPPKTENSLVQSSVQVVSGYSQDSYRRGGDLAKAPAAPAIQHRARRWGAGSGGPTVVA